MLRGVSSATCAASLGLLVTLSVTAAAVYMLVGDVGFDGEAELRAVVRAYLASSRNTGEQLRQLEEQMNALDETAATNNDHLQTVLLRIKRLVARAQKRLEVFND